MAEQLHMFGVGAGSPARAIDRTRTLASASSTSDITRQLSDLSKLAEDLKALARATSPKRQP
jgi:hypothetical protein